MTNRLHAPERHADESFEQYKARRALSQRIVGQHVNTPRQQPAINALDTARFFVGTHTTTASRRSRRSGIKAMGRRQFLKILKAMKRGR